MKKPYLMLVLILLLTSNCSWLIIEEEVRLDESLMRPSSGMERGVELYLTHCVTCHGLNGYGISETAPALNNPHLFGFDPLAEINTIITNAESEINILTEELDQLNIEAIGVDNPVSDERLTEIFNRIEEIDRSIIVLEDQIKSTGSERVLVIAELYPAIANGLYPSLNPENIPPPPDDMTSYLITNGTRLKQVGWTGTVEGYINTVLIHGRPDSGDRWSKSEGMVAWSQVAGGPLRRGDINALTIFIMSWDKGDDWSIADYLTIKQFGKPLISPIPRDNSYVEDILEVFETEGITGNAIAGAELYNGRFGCSICHSVEGVAPTTELTWARVLNERLAEPQFAVYTGEQYLVESIVRPGDYIVDGYTNAMPQTFGDQLTHQQLADIVEYLKTQE